MPLLWLLHFEFLNENKRVMQGVWVVSLVLILTGSSLDVVCAPDDVFEGCDEIIKVDGTIIQAKVEEVGEELISFRLCDFLDGPLRKIRRNEVFLIKYSNGSTETFARVENKEEDDDEKEPRQKVERDKTNRAWYVGGSIGAVQRHIGTKGYDLGEFDTWMQYHPIGWQLSGNARVLYDSGISLTSSLDFVRTRVSTAEYAPSFGVRSEYVVWSWMFGSAGIDYYFGSSRNLHLGAGLYLGAWLQSMTTDGEQIVVTDETGVVISASDSFFDVWNHDQLYEYRYEPGFQTNIGWRIPLDERLSLTLNGHYRHALRSRVGEFLSRKDGNRWFSLEVGCLFQL